MTDRNTQPSSQPNAGSKQPRMIMNNRQQETRKIKIILLVLEYLREQLPRAFRSKNAVVPFKMGIREELMAWYAALPNPAFSRRKISQALIYYTHRPQYYLACQAGVPRINLLGQACGDVTEEQAIYAQEKYTTHKVHSRKPSKPQNRKRPYTPGARGPQNNYPRDRTASGHPSSYNNPQPPQRAGTLRHPYALSSAHRNPRDAEYQNRPQNHYPDRSYSRSPNAPSRSASYQPAENQNFTSKSYYSADDTPSSTRSGNVAITHRRRIPQQWSNTLSLGNKKTESSAPPAANSNQDEHHDE